MKKTISKHHIIPISRIKKHPKTAYIDDYDHRHYHTLFGNATPIEILDRLVNYYWNGTGIKYIKEYLNNS